MGRRTRSLDRSRAVCEEGANPLVLRHRLPTVRPYSYPVLVHWLTRLTKPLLIALVSAVSPSSIAPTVKSTPEDDVRATPKVRACLALHLAENQI
jgi:hypothetical protein